MTDKDIMIVDESSLKDKWREQGMMSLEGYEMMRITI